MFRVRYCSTPIAGEDDRHRGQLDVEHLDPAEPPGEPRQRDADQPERQHVEEQVDGAVAGPGAPRRPEQADAGPADQERGGPGERAEHRPLPLRRHRERGLLARVAAARVKPRPAFSRATRSGKSSSAASATAAPATTTYRGRSRLALRRADRDRDPRRGAGEDGDRERPGHPQEAPGEAHRGDDADDRRGGVGALMPRRREGEREQPAAERPGGEPARRASAATARRAAARARAPRRGRRGAPGRRSSDDHGRLARCVPLR